MTSDSVKCIRGVKESLSDPNSRLSGWNFSNTCVPGSICAFDGVTCWNPQENRIVELNLDSMGLSGQFPSSLQFCSDMTALYLSGSSLYGYISAELCTWMPYLVVPGLSNNTFSGPIPPELSNCR